MRWHCCERECIAVTQLRTPCIIHPAIANPTSFTLHHSPYIIHPAIAHPTLHHSPLARPKSKPRLAATAPRAPTQAKWTRWCSTPIRTAACGVMRTVSRSRWGTTPSSSAIIPCGAQRRSRSSIRLSSIEACRTSTRRRGGLARRQRCTSTATVRLRKRVRSMGSRGLGGERQAKARHKPQTTRDESHAQTSSPTGRETAATLSATHQVAALRTRQTARSGARRDSQPKLTTCRAGNRGDPPPASSFTPCVCPPPPPLTPLCLQEPLRGVWLLEG